MKVTSASRQIESLNEAPAPITVITSDMIRKSGARTLQDLLLTFAPGVTFVADQNEINVAMHGVYASAQQKTLVMRDGHRLNSHAFSNLDPGVSEFVWGQWHASRAPRIARAHANRPTLAAPRWSPHAHATAHGHARAGLNRGRSYRTGHC